MKKILVVIFFIGSVPCAAQPFEPVNDEATEEARALLDYLYQIDEAHILSGQHNYNRDLNAFSEQASQIAGASPAVWGTDFIGYEERGMGPEVVEEAIEKHEQGYLVTLMWHAGRPIDQPPYDWDANIQGELTEAQWEAMTTPGTDLHARWQEQVDGVAEYLKDLRDAGVPVLWRPYHEMNGTWFWWGAKKGEDGYVKLWRMMYDRYVNHHDLTNLIWVWNANAPRDIPGDRADAYEHYYPGHEYVDVLAADVYHSDYEQKDYEQLLDLADGRVVALGEVGALPSVEILETQPRWAWFMVWSNFIEDENRPHDVRAIYDHPLVLTHDEVDP